MAKRRLAVEIVGDAEKLDRAYKDGADGADRFEKRTSDAFDRSGKAADDFERKGSGLAAKADGWGRDIAIGLGAAGGALAAGLFVKGFSDALDREVEQAKLGIQLGLPPEMAKEAGRLAGEVYTSGFGESLDESNQAVRYITQNMGGLGDVTRDEMKEMTKGVLTLADAFDEDLNSVTGAAGTIMKNGLAGDGKEALDILTRGLQSPANKAEDLLDTFTEYSTAFRQLGISGPQALGLLNQAIAGGARNSDVAADALKEFAIAAQQATDATTPAAQAFSTLGLDAQDMATKFAMGGPQAAEALQVITDALRGVEDPATRSQLAVQLFGTKAEDLQQAVFSFDLSNASTQIGNVEGAMNSATTATDTNKASVEAWKRSMEENVTNFIAGSVIPWLDTMQLKLKDMGDQWNTGRGYVGDFHAGMMVLGDGFIWVRDHALDPFIGQLQTLFGWIGDTIEKVEDLWAKIQGDHGSLTGGLFGLGGFGLAGGVLGMLAGSFADGGVIPGRKGSPQLILAHGGETVLPTHEMSFGAALQGMTNAGSYLDARSILDIRGGGPGMTSSASGPVVNNFYGPVMGEQDFLQRLRSGNYQAARTGRSF